jgi:DNA-binding CsgD family transcriptional regulator
MISLEAFSELLQVLYSAPLNQEQWQRFLTLVSNQTNSHNGFFLSADTASGLAALAHGHEEQDADIVSAYNEKHARQDPIRASLFRRARTGTPIGVFSDEELLPHEGLLRTDLYRQLLAKADFRYGTFTVLALSVRRFDAISVWRTAYEGPMDSDSKRLLKLLIPHVQTALELRRVLGATKQRLASAEAIANASVTATFLLTEKGSIRHLNSAAEALIRAGDGLTVADGTLTSCDPLAKSALSKLFKDAASPSLSLSDPQPSQFLALGRPSKERRLQLLATPLPETHRQRCQAELLLLVTDPEKPSTFPDDALRALFDLTPTETEIANGLMMGYSPQEIACLRRVSTGTVRQQVKTMLNKAGTNRQSDMVRLFMTLPQIPVQIT